MLCVCMYIYNANKTLTYPCMFYVDISMLLIKHSGLYVCSAYVSTFMLVVGHSDLHVYSMYERMFTLLMVN